MKLSQSALRALVASVLRSDADFDAFVSDRLPQVRGRFTDGMDRVRKTTLLLEHADPEQLERLLRARQHEEQDLTVLNITFEEALRAKVAALRPAAGQLRIGFPQSLGHVFIGREAAIKGLHRALRGGRVALRSAEARAGHVSAHGGGGIGKSRLAIEYAHECADEYPGGIFFTVAGARAPLAIWAEFARESALRRPDLFAGDLDRDDDAALAFARWLADPAPGQRLLVIDDVSGNDADEIVKRFSPHEVRGTAIWPLPAGALVHVLFTTRLRELPGARAIPVPALLPEAACKLLLARSGREKLGKEEEARALDLASRTLGGHPLAIALAGAYLRKVGPGYTFADYGEDMKRRGTLQMLEEAARLAGHRVVDHERSIIATYELSRSLLDPADPIDALAWRILALAACLASNVAIDRGFIKRLLAQEGGRVEKSHVGLGTERLLELSLLSPAPEGADEGDVVIHLLVAEYTGWVMGQSERRRVLTAVVDAARGLLPSHYGDFWKVSRSDAYRDWERLSSARETHVLEVWARSESLGTRARGRLGTAIGDLYMARGELSQALAVYREAMRILQPAKGPSTPQGQRELCIVHERIGDVLKARGDLAAALREYRRGMEIRRGLVDLDPGNAELQRDLLVSHDNIGNVLSAQGSPSSAFDEYRAELSIAEHLALQDPVNTERQRDLSVSHTRVGNVLKAQGNAAAALVEYRTAMQIRERLARQEPTNAGWQLDLSRCYIKLGKVLQNQGQPEAARIEYQKAMEIREALARQDPENPGWQADFAYSLRCLASTMPPRSDEARSHLHRAHRILSALASASRLTFNQQQELHDLEHRLQQLFPDLDEPRPTPVPHRTARRSR